MAMIGWNDPGYPSGERKPLAADFGAWLDEMQRLFSASSGLAGSGYPPVNLYEDDVALYMTAELPGLTRRDIELSLEGENLFLKGERQADPEAARGSYHRRERSSGSFLKRITLPARVDASKLSAELKDGVLLVKMAKPAEIRPRKISIKTG